jgi:hypothetical protein
MRKHDRALRRVVVRLQGCLARVPRAERRVLVLRAGVGIAHTRSRARVARITGLRRARVVLLERRGLRHLRALGRAGACAAPDGGNPAVRARAPVAASPERGGPTGRGGVRAQRESATSRPARSAHSGSSKEAELPLGRPALSNGGPSIDFLLVLIPLALIATAVGLAVEIRRMP